MSQAAPIALAPFTGGASLLALGTGNLFKTPTPPEAKKPANPSTPAVQQAVAEAAARRSRARGFQSTILSQLAPQNATQLKQTFGS